jgi:hypothetical protein
MFPLANLTMPMLSSNTDTSKANAMPTPQASSKSAFPTPFGISAPAARFTAPTIPGAGTKLVPLPAASSTAGAASKPPISFVAPAKPASGSASVYTPMKAVSITSSLSQRGSAAAAAKGVGDVGHAESTGNSFLQKLSERRLMRFAFTNSDGTEVLVALNVHNINGEIRPRLMLHHLFDGRKHNAPQRCARCRF